VGEHDGWIGCYQSSLRFVIFAHWFLFFPLNVDLLHWVW